jgi:RimJ/RimL family protein N-acetyltransferase
MHHTHQTSALSTRRIALTECTQACARGEQVFAVTARDSGAALGSVRLIDVDMRHRRAGLDLAWLAAAASSASSQTDAIYLLLRFAFERLDCRRVEARLEADNRLAAEALRRFGMRRDGVLRAFESDSDGHPRDVAVWSVIASEWREVERRLCAALAMERWPWKDGLPTLMPP